VNGAFSLILGLSLAGGATCLAVFAAGLPFRKHIKKSWLIYLWLVVLLRFIIPVPLNLPFITGGINSNILTISAKEPAPASVSADNLVMPDSSPISDGDGQSAQSALTDQNASASAMPDDASASAVSDNTVTVHNPVIPTGLASTLPDAADTGAAPAGTMLLGILPYLWLFGVSLMVIWTVTGYALTMLKLRRGRALLIQDRVPVYETNDIMTPILTGILRPAIYLPAGFPNRALAIQHELTHFRRGDIWLKWLVQLTVCVHWFNPLASTGSVSWPATAPSSGASIRRSSRPMARCFSTRLMPSRTEAAYWSRPSARISASWPIGSSRSSVPGKRRRKLSPL
jgi:beta-lactamase regulating signal transducer with metallopeptidase domain